MIEFFVGYLTIINNFIVYTTLFNYIRIKNYEDGRTNEI